MFALLSLWFCFVWTIFHVDTIFGLVETVFGLVESFFCCCENYFCLDEHFLPCLRLVWAHTNTVTQAKSTQPCTKHIYTHHHDTTHTSRASHTRNHSNTHTTHTGHREMVESACQSVRRNRNEKFRVYTDDTHLVLGLQRKRCGRGKGFV